MFGVSFHPGVTLTDASVSGPEVSLAFALMGSVMEVVSSSRSS